MLKDDVLDPASPLTPAIGPDLPIHAHSKMEIALVVLVASSIEAQGHRDQGRAVDSAHLVDLGLAVMIPIIPEDEVGPD